jgi:hypothetical protein
VNRIEGNDEGRKLEKSRIVPRYFIFLLYRHNILLLQIRKFDYKKNNMSTAREKGREPKGQE